MVFKKSIKPVLCLLLFSINIIVVAQTDSLHIITDTVIVKSPPVVIKKTIYIQENATKNNNKWHVGFECNIGNTLGNHMSTNPKKYATSMAIFGGKEIHHVYFNLGIGIMTMYKNQTYQSVVHTTTNQNMIIPDTIDIYSQEHNPVYVIQNKTITKTYSTQKDTNIHQNVRIRYLQLSSIIGYNFNIWKIKLSAFTGIKPCFVNSTNNNLATQIKKTIQPYLIYIPLGVRISYHINESIQFHTNLHYLFNLQSFTNNNNEKNTIQNIGIGFNYMF
jgi:hypothetical protein